MFGVVAINRRSAGIHCQQPSAIPRTLIRHSQCGICDPLATTHRNPNHHITYCTMRQQSHGTQHSYLPSLKPGSSPRDAAWHLQPSQPRCHETQTPRPSHAYHTALQSPQYTPQPPPQTGARKYTTEMATPGHARSALSTTLGRLNRPNLDAPNTPDSPSTVGERARAAVGDPAAPAKLPDSAVEMVRLELLVAYRELERLLLAGVGIAGSRALERRLRELLRRSCIMKLMHCRTLHTSSGARSVSTSCEPPSLHCCITARTRQGM
eukprot:GHUV01026604.1.p1 GENE.GHUV01026604.1~~GHUV01026604.1.p1  ORF type:complete len:266 (+),score=37.63 GHUV01026604.1:140-937(+)